MSGALMMVVATALAVGALCVLVLSTVRSIRNERRQGRPVWKDFGLTLVLMLLFLSTWIAQAIAEWQVYTDEARAHGEPTSVADFFSQFSQSTLENWQSEFLQLFAFVALSALYIHRGSAESKDSDERTEASLRRIEERLGTLPPSSGDTDNGKLPEPSLEGADGR